MKKIIAIIVIVAISAGGVFYFFNKDMVSSAISKSIEAKSDIKFSNTIAVIETNGGVIEIELRPDIAPKAVENFATHIKNGYYNNLIFHRIIKDFMIQGGDPTATGSGGKSIWGNEFEDEFKEGVVFDKAGILAMANAGKNTNGSQFFITTVPTPWLNNKHTIFGYVLKSSMGALSRLENARTVRNRPMKVQKITKAYLREK